MKKYINYLVVVFIAMIFSIDVVNAKSASSQGYCLYKNLGLCAGFSGKESDARESDVDGIEYCTQNGNGSTAMSSSYFIRSYYAVFEYHNGDILGVYLPKYERDPDVDVFNIQDAIYDKLTDDVKKFDGSMEQMNDLLSNYFTKVSVAISADANAATESIGQCPRWFNDVNGTEGQDYDDAMYWYQYYNTDEKENEDTEDPGGAGDEFENVGAGGPFFCGYNEGRLIMKVNYDSSGTKIMVYSPNQSVSSAFWKYAQGSGAEDVTWVSANKVYGDIESGNDGSFEKLISQGTCPNKLKYNPFDKALVVCELESDCADEEGFYSAVGPVFSNEDDSNLFDSEYYETCEALIGEELKATINQYMTLFRILVPIIVLVLGTVDFVSAVFSSNEDGMKKAQSKFMKRLVIAVVIFLVPTFVNLLMDIANTVWGWNVGDCGIG